MNGHFLVASDMDHTLLMPGRKVSPGNMRAIERLREAGGILTLSTGRSFYIVSSYIRDLSIDVPVIASNGASVYDPVQRREIFSSLIKESTARPLLGLFAATDTNATLYAPDGIYLMPGSTRGKFMEDYNLGLPDELKAPVRKLRKEDLAGELPPFNKFLLIEPAAEVLDEVRSHEDLDVVSSAGGFYDVMNRGVSKGTGLLMIADMLGIDRSRTYAAGDSENDLSMLQAAAHAVAMADSDPRLLDIAEYVTLTCEEDGFARAVDDFILRNES